MAEQNRGVSKKTSTPNTAHLESSSRNVAAHPLQEYPQRQLFPSGSGSVQDDLVYNLVKRDAPDYQDVNRGPPPHTPAQPSAAGSPPKPPPAQSAPVSQAPGPSSSSPSHISPAPLPKHAHTTRQPVNDNVRPQPCPTTQQPSRQNLRSTTEVEDEIPELRGTGRSTEDTEKTKKEGQGEEGGTKMDPVSEIPNTNFAIACMVALCFNLPMGILAMYFSLKATKAFLDGHVKLGQKRSRWSIFASLIGIAFTTMVVSSIILYIALEGHKRIRAYSIKAGLSL